MRLNKNERIRRNDKSQLSPRMNHSIMTNLLVGIVCLTIVLLVLTVRRIEMVVEQQLRQQQDLLAQVLEHVSDGGQQKEAPKEAQPITQHRVRKR